MTALVEDRVALWLSDHPGATAIEIARGVHAADKTVREALSSPLFTFTVVGKSNHYYLRGTQRDESRRAERRDETDCQFLLRVLSDGEPHSLNEILRRSFADRGCGLTVHSRAADLRARGYTINNWKDGKRGDGSKYRLLGVGDVDGMAHDRLSAPTPSRLLGEPDGLETDTDPGSSPVRRSTVPYPSGSPSQPLTEPGPLLPAVEVAPPLAGPDAGSGLIARGSVGSGDPRPGSVSGPGDAVSGGTPDDGAVPIGSETDGQLTFAAPQFRRHAA